MLNELKAGLSRAWEGLAEGWAQLQERAGEALTRFSPAQSAQAETTAEERTALKGSRWSVLAAEVRDDEAEILVRLEIPGMDTEDFDIEVRDGRLIVRGHKRVEREEQRGDYYLMERAYGQFERMVALPADVEASEARADYSRGVLSVRLPKRASARTRRIEVKRG